MLSGKQVQQTVGRDTLNGIFIFLKIALFVQSSKVLKLIDIVQHLMFQFLILISQNGQTHSNNCRLLHKNCLSV